MNKRYMINDQEYDNVSLDNKVGFVTERHRYTYVDDPSLYFRSVTGLLKEYKPPFDSAATAQKVVANPSSKYFGMEWEDVVAQWRLKAETASREGSILHEYGEYLLNNEPYPHPPDLPKAQYVPQAIETLWEMGYELAKTELLLYSLNLQLAGQSDVLLKKSPEYFAIYDWKFLSKPLKKNSYYNTKERKYQKLDGPFRYLDDCNWIHYSIQTAIYETLTGQPELIKEKVLIVVTDDGYTFEPCYPMRVFWDEDEQLQAIYETPWNKKWYDSRTNKFYKRKPKL